MLRTTIMSLALGLIVGLGGCAGNSNSVEVRMTNSQPNAAKTSVPTGPLAVDELKVTISQVSFHQSANAGDVGAGWTNLAMNVTLNLLDLQNNVNALLGTIDLPPGSYQQVRVTVASATVRVGTQVSDVTIVGNGVLRILLNLTVVAGTQYSVLLDFDAQASLKLNEQNQTWKIDPPVIRATVSAI